MSVHAMKPTFKDLEGYREWRRQWRSLYARLSSTIRTHKFNVKAIQRNGEDAAKVQKTLHYERAMAFKLMTILDEAKERWKRILAMKAQIEEQNASFPLMIADCRTIDFHYNKGSIEFPDLPTWIIKTKGRTFYINHVEASVPWSTRELPEGSTKGMMRFRNCDLHIDANGVATISESKVVSIAA